MVELWPSPAKLVEFGSIMQQSLFPLNVFTPIIYNHFNPSKPSSLAAEGNICNQYKMVLPIGLILERDTLLIVKLSNNILAHKYRSLFEVPGLKSFFGGIFINLFYLQKCLPSNMEVEIMLK